MNRYRLPRGVSLRKIIAFKHPCHGVLASDFVYDFIRSPVAILAGVVVLFLFLLAIFAPLVAPTNPFNPASLNLMNGFTPPLTPNMFTGQSFVMGTDDQGRDLLSAIIYGLRVSLFVGMMSVLLAMGIGVSLGLVAGYVGGWLDNLIMRIADIQLTFPSILIAMLIFGVLRGGDPSGRSAAYARAHRVGVCVQSHTVGALRQCVGVATLRGLHSTPRRTDKGGRVRLNLCVVWGIAAVAAASGGLLRN